MIYKSQWFKAMNPKKCTALLLLLTSIISAFSCGDTVSDPETVTTKAQTSDTVEDEDDSIKCELPSLDYNNADVTIFVEDYGGTCGPEFYAEEITGDIVNDAVYKRNQTISDQLHINLQYELFEHAWNDRDNFTTKLRTSVLAQDGSYDIIAGTGYFMPNFLSDGLFTDMSELPYIDIDKPWWSKKFMEVSSIDGKYYFVTGDACLGLIRNMYCIFENLDLAEAANVENLYDVVRDGKWTLDKMNEVASSLYRDLNGNTQIDKDDQFGLLLDGGNHITGFFESIGIDIIDFSSGEPEFIYDNEHNINAVEKLTNIVMNTEGIFFDKQANDEVADESIFKNGNVLLSTGWLTHTESFRNLNFTYGVLPYPKYDEADEYRTTVFPCYSILTIPVDSLDKERAAAVCEALAYESWKNVTPAYFETALKVKYANDNDSAQMFDIIRDSVSFDFGYIYTLPLDGINNYLKFSVMDDKPWASYIASMKSVFVEKIDTLVENIRSVNE